MDVYHDMAVFLALMVYLVFEALMVYLVLPAPVVTAVTPVHRDPQVSKAVDKQHGKKLNFRLTQHVKFCVKFPHFHLHF